MQLREARTEDIPQISQLYFDTVHHINAKDYNPRQIQAWAPEVYDQQFWAPRFQRYQVFVIEHEHEHEHEILGFCEFESDGHIDCFYVHHAWQGKGVGTRMMERIVEEAKRRQLHRLYADVSITALPFFQHQGFSVLHEQQRSYRGLRFTMFEMEKALV